MSNSTLLPDILAFLKREHEYDRRGRDALIARIELDLSCPSCAQGQAAAVSHVGGPAFHYVDGKSVRCTAPNARGRVSGGEAV